MQTETLVDELRLKIKELEKAVSNLEKENETLREDAEKYKRIFETVPVSIEVVDENGIITEVNLFHVNHVGQGKTSKEDYIGRYIVMRKTFVQAGLSEKLKSLLAGNRIDEKEVYFPTTTGGKDAYVNVRGEPIVHHQKIIGAVVIGEDVTQLKKSQEDLIRYQEKLEELIEARTIDLKNAYTELQQENIERKKTQEEKEKVIAELQEALAKVKTLTGLLPICASCKKIRDDKGYWHQVEVYIRDHSEADFSHGICPECKLKLYPDIFGGSACNG